MSDPFTFEELTDRDLAILDHYVWGKDVPFRERSNDPVAVETMNLRRRIDTEIERRKQSPRKFRTTEYCQSAIGSTIERLLGERHE